jgi:N-acetylglucosamine repressor
VLNRHRVLNYIRSRRQASRAELADALQLDRKTITNIVDALSDETLLAPIGYRKSEAGRRQELLTINGSHSNYIGLDLGATHVTGVLVDTNLNVRDRQFFEIRPGLKVELIIDQMKATVRALLGSHRKTAAVRGVGVCVPGFVNPKTGLSIVSENIPGWRQVDLNCAFASEFSEPIVLEDSSRALGLAEKWLGEGGNKKDFLVLDIGYGIGMAIFVNGRLYTGSSYKSGEIGHTVAQANGNLCTCGNRGCLETVASGKAIAVQAKQGVLEKKSEILMDLARGTPELLTAQDVGLAAGLGDEYSVRLLSQAGTYLGISLANVINVFNPSLVVLGGGLVNAGLPLLESLTEALKADTMMGIRDGLEIVVSKLEGNGSAVGASILAMQPLFSYSDMFLADSWDSQARV